jgi:hypothetical protein
MTCQEEWVVQRFLNGPLKGSNPSSVVASFFEARRLSKLLMELYKTDRELTMRIMELIIKHQVDYMSSLGCLVFICIASLEDQLSVVGMLAPHEMSPGILDEKITQQSDAGQEMVLRLKLKSEIDVLLKVVFYKPTPYHTEFLAKFGKLNPTQEAALKSDVPLCLWPPRYQPLDRRLKRWKSHRSNLILPSHTLH